MTGIFENRFLQSVFLSTLEKFREFGMCSENAQIPWDELNHQTKKGAIRTDWKMITFEPNTYFTLPAHSTLSHTKVSIARELYSLPRTHSSLTHHYRFYHHQHILHSAHTLDFLSHEQYSLLRTPFSPTNSLFPHTSLSNPISQKLTSLSPHTRISLTNISPFHELHSLPRIHFHLTHHSPAQYHQHILHSPHTLDSFSHEHYLLSRTSFSLTNSSLTHHPRIQYHQHILHSPHTLDSFSTKDYSCPRTLFSPRSFTVHIHQEIEIFHTHHTRVQRYGVATNSRFHKITSLFCRIQSLL